MYRRFHAAHRAFPFLIELDGAVVRFVNAADGETLNAIELPSEQTAEALYETEVARVSLAGTED